MKVNAVFDIGKTNKKFFLFDDEYNEVHREYVNLPQTVDEDGFETEDMEALRYWIKDTFDRILEQENFEVKTLNFSSYGASLVHIDYKGRPLTPLYNYLKDYPADISDKFCQKYGSALDIAVQTASPQAGMLNSGMQLYWLKQTKPDIFASIKYSLHLPQYLSYLFTGIPVSEYTSIGCHTGLWDYEADDYHTWVHEEGIDRILPPIVPTSASINTTYKDKKIKIGVGIHDSSSALLPYILSKKKPFLLLSTGTWSIALNPFNSETLSRNDILENSLNYLRIDGKRVKAARFFMGNEYRLQVEQLSTHFQKEYGYHRDVKFDQNIYLKLVKDEKTYFRFEGESFVERPDTDLGTFKSFEIAYHRLMIELMKLQIDTINRAIGNTEIRTIYIDGGFTDNDVFMKLMSHHFGTYKVLSTQSPLGSALGAAMVISDKKVTNNFLKENYRMKKLVPLFF